LAGVREFQIFAKPGGAVCNLDCRYCYYLEKQALYPDIRVFRMSEELLEEYIVQLFEVSPGEVIRFSWHGGEPTILGLDYFQRIVEIQRKHAPSEKRVVNGLVTNGTLLDDEWCAFFSGEGFSVGLSLDGPANLHDRFRVSKNAKPTHSLVMRGFELLQTYGVPCDILCVVHEENACEPKQVYRFFKQIGATYVGFLPLVVPPDAGSGGAGEHTVPAEEYGTFLTTIFDEWIRNDIGRILIQNFDEAARPVRCLEHSLCIFRETCGDIPALEHNGDLYSCDHFVEADYLLGNIGEKRLLDMLYNKKHREFGDLKRDSLPRFCLECDVLAMCNGGCPKDRFVRAPTGEHGLNYLCTGFKKFFSHCRPMFEKLVPLWRTGASQDQLMVAARGDNMVDASRVGRNDPCPCGSGKKYKRCCMVSGE
jgi:uncharacterized protein